MHQTFNLKLQKTAIQISCIYHFQIRKKLQTTQRLANKRGGNLTYAFDDENARCYDLSLCTASKISPKSTPLFTTC